MPSLSVIDIPNDNHPGYTQHEFHGRDCGPYLLEISKDMVKIDNIFQNESPNIRKL